MSPLHQHIQSHRYARRSIAAAPALHEHCSFDGTGTYGDLDCLLNVASDDIIVAIVLGGNLPELDISGLQLAPVVV